MNQRTTVFPNIYYFDIIHFKSLEIERKKHLEHPVLNSSDLNLGVKN